MTTHQRLANRPASFGTETAVCSCGWTSAPTNRPQHLGRTFRSHAAAVRPRRVRYPYTITVQTAQAGRQTEDFETRAEFDTFMSANERYVTSYSVPEEDRP